MNVLVINAGSSSLKYQLVHVENHAVIAKGICERFFDILAAQADFPFPLHASIGIGLSETSGHSYAEFYRTADSALYKAKGDGKNRWRMERL